MADAIVSQHHPIISRAEAKAIGLKRFFTGIPCKYGHVSERSVTSSACLVCNKGYYWKKPEEKLRVGRERLEKQRREDPEQRSAKHNAASEARRAALAAGIHKYPAQRPCRRGHMGERYVRGHCVECMRLQRSTDIEARRLLERVAASARRARKKQVGGSHSQEEIRVLLVKQKFRCAESTCGRSIRKSFHADHITPLALGGHNGILNIQLLCPTCNQRKCAKDPIKWAQENGRLL